MEKPKFLGQGEWTAYLHNRDEQIPIIANGKAVAFIPPLHEDAIAIATLIPIAVNAYCPMLEALKSISVNASINLDLHKEGQIQNLSKCVNMLLEIATKAIALAENKQ